MKFIEPAKSVTRVRYSHREGDGLCLHHINISHHSIKRDMDVAYECLSVVCELRGIHLSVVAVAIVRDAVILSTQ